MEIKNIWVVYFSPTGSTKKLLEHMAMAASNQLGEVPVKILDFTRPEFREKSYSFSKEDFVFLGSPTYAGRIPNKMLSFIRNGFIGNGAYGVPVVTYGNRNYDFSLVELFELMEESGFSVIAGGAFVCQHAFADTLAFGRPDQKDFAMAENFGTDAAKKVGIENDTGKITIPMPENHPVKEYYIPKGLDGKPAVFLKAKPKTDPGKCRNCGICADLCPMGSISREDVTDVKGVCIKCQACIKNCPAGAKYFDDAAFTSHKKMLEENYSDKVSFNELFF